MDARQANKSEIKFIEGKGEIHCKQIIAAKVDGRINMAMTTFTLEFELESMIQVRWLLGFIPINQIKTCKRNDELTMSEDQKNLLKIWCQVKLFNYVDEKCKNAEIE
ncbi:Hypothetical predicted protein, partial [Paramuricea clavata]